MFSCCLSTAGVCFLGTLCPPGDWAFLTVGLPARPKTNRTLTGFPRSACARCDRGGRPLYPEASGVPTTDRAPRSPLAVPPRPGPIPRCSSHLPRLHLTRYPQGFKFVHPSGLPLTCTPGWNGVCFDFFPELRTPQLPATHVRAGTSYEHCWELRHRHHAGPPICELARLMQPRCRKLSSDLLRESARLRRTDGVVAGAADHDRLSAPLGHEPCPFGLWSGSCEIC